MAVDGNNRASVIASLETLFPDSKIETTPLTDLLENGMTVNTAGKPIGKDITVKAQGLLNRR